MLRRMMMAGSSAPTARIHWRIEVARTSAGFNYPTSVAELELRAAPGGANLAVGGTASADTEYDATYAASKAFDGNAATAWSTTSGTKSTPPWIRYDLPSAAIINEVQVRARNTVASTQGWREFNIQSSLDGVTWVTEWSVIGQPGWANGEVRTFTRP